MSLNNNSVNYSEIIDISWPLTNTTSVYPGNPPIKITPIPSASSRVSRLEFGTHSGTHFDAPVHDNSNDRGMDVYPLELFIGPCRVIDATSESETISLQLVQSIKPLAGERLLFRTTNSELPKDKFFDDYIYLSGDAADYLAEVGVGLVGVDYLSIKQRGSSDHRPHTSLLSKHIAIIEALDLSKVEAGSFTLVAFPLNIPDGDGAPARVVLLK